MSAPIDLAMEPGFAIGRLRVDPPRREVTGDDGAARTIEPRQMQVLIALAQQAGETVGREQLIARCWQGRAVSRDAVERAIAGLRALEAEVSPGSFTITAVPRVGYRLEARAATDVPAPAEPGRPALSRRALVASGVGAGLALALVVPPVVRRLAPGDGALPVVIEVDDSFSSDPQLRAAATAQAREITALLGRLEGVAAGTTHHRNGYVVRVFTDIAGARVRTGATVSRTDGNVVVATATTDAGVADLLGAQQRIAAQVLQFLAGWVTVDHVAHALPPVRRDGVALEAASRAEALLVRSRDAFMNADLSRGRALADAALAETRRALAIDAADPGALVVLAKLTKYGTPTEFVREDLTPDLRERRAEALIGRALAVDPNDPVVLAALGDHYRRYQWRWQESENLLRRALARQPGLIDAQWSLAYLLGMVGRGLEGLASARRLVALDSSSAWYRLAVPRLLDACGRRGEAAALYAAEQRRAPDNVFVLREIYLTHFIRGDVAALRALAGDVACGADPCADVRAFAARTMAAANALAGDRAGFLTILDAEAAAYDASVVAGATRHGRAKVDLLYLFAIEYAWIGQVEPALRFLERALAARSLYWPVTLPLGVAQFPPATRDSPRFAALWAANPRLQDLLRRRLAGLKAQQMAGVFPDGTVIARV